MALTEICRIIRNERMAEGIFDMRLESEKIAPLAGAGQFVHIVCPGFTLRRPISVCSAGEGELRLIYEVRGRGTAALSKLLPGDTADILGPLGRGYPKLSGHILAVGGGIGAPPMLGLAKGAEKASAVLGFRSAGKAILIPEFEKICARVEVATDDGSLGYKGTVLPAVERVLGEENISAVCACGPTIMLKNLAALLEKREVPLYVSLEQRMGCGVGACLVCSVKIKTADGWKYERVCRDGPVFNAREVCWDE